MRECVRAALVSRDENRVASNTAWHILGCWGLCLDDGMGCDIAPWAIFQTRRLKDNSTHVHTTTAQARQGLGNRLPYGVVLLCGAPYSVYILRHNTRWNAKHGSGAERRKRQRPPGKQVESGRLKRVCAVLAFKCAMVSSRVQVQVLFAHCHLRTYVRSGCRCPLKEESGSLFSANLGHSWSSWWIVLLHQDVCAAPIQSGCVSIGPRVFTFEVFRMALVG